MSVERAELRFPSAGEVCAAWLYRPTAPQPWPCVVMAHGFSLTRHDGLAAYAERLCAAGAAVLVFDHRYLGDSAGAPRQRFREPAQLQDWRSAVAFARTLEGVDAERIVLWGYSFAGAHAIETAAADPQVAATLALCPMLDGLARALATPWRSEISPAVFLTVPLHRPLRHAKQMRMPVWLGLGERDITVSGKAIERFAARAPDAELKRYPYDHFGAFLDDAPELVASDQVSFLSRRGILAAAAPVRA